jgi:hypothetical protein
MATTLREPINSYAMRRDLPAEICVVPRNLLTNDWRMRSISSCRPSTRTGT